MEFKRITRQEHHATAAERLQMVEQFRYSGLTGGCLLPAVRYSAGHSELVAGQNDTRFEFAGGSRN